MKAAAKVKQLRQLGPARHRGDARKQHINFPQDKEDRTWHDDAACRGVDIDVFYPVSEADYGAGKAICNGCTVQAECLELGMREGYGLFGGLTPTERHRIRRKPRPTTWCEPCGRSYVDISKHRVWIHGATSRGRASA